jgi:hypothetical protein
MFSNHCPFISGNQYAPTATASPKSEAISSDTYNFTVCLLLLFSLLNKNGRIYPER